MKRTHYILTIVLSITFKVSIGQTEEYMHIIRENIEKTTPTMVNDTSSHNMQSKYAGYDLVAIKPTPCNETLMGKPINERIARREYKNDTLDIEVAIVANCCSSFLGEIQITNDTILNIIFTEYGEQCMCTCCFQLTYQIATKENKLASFQLNGEPIIETNQVLKDEKTEEIYYDNGNLKTVIYTLGDEVILVRHYNTEGTHIQTDYYHDGILIKEIKK